MKRLTSYIVLSALLAFSGCTGPSVEAPAADPVRPEAEYSIPGTELQVDKFESVDFRAVLKTPAPVECGWWVGGEKISATPDMVYKFDNAGVYDVEFRAWNEAGTETHAYQVTVVGVPLVVELSDNSDEIGIYGGQRIILDAVVTAGGFGLSQEWILDGVTVGSGSGFEKAFTEDELGTYTLVYRAANSDGFVVGHSWTVKVTEMPLVPLMYADFEMGASIHPSISGMSGALAIIDNPFKTGANGSGKVLSDNITGSTGSASGYVQIVPDADIFPLSRRARYSTVRVKVWMGASDYYPYLQTQTASHKRLPNRINGTPLLDPSGKEVALGYFSPYTSDQRDQIAASVRSLIRTDDWNVLDFDLSSWSGLGYTDLSKLTSMQFKPMCKVDGSNMAAGAANETTNLRKVYVDDIEFIPAGWNE